MLKTTVTCGKCNNNSITYNPFMTMSLAFENSLERCISNFLKEDKLDSAEKYKCEKCNRNSNAIIKSDLSAMPPILVFHLKRFAYPSMKKIKGRVKFSTQIDMTKYVGFTPANSQDVVYELFAMTVHSGNTIDSGHYVAVVKRHGRWFAFDDE